MEPDVREVLNYVRALEYGLHRLHEFPLSLRLIRELHAYLMEGVRGESQTPGEFRRTPNWIGPHGSNLNTAPYVPPPVQEMHQALGDLERYLYAEPQLPHLIRLGLIHYQFEAIHPFLDGNGRIGRLLIVLLLCAWELLPQPLLYLSAFFQTHRDDYLDLLSAVSQSGAWQEWLDFFLTGVITQARDAVTRTRRLQDIREYYRDRFQKDRKAARLLGVVDYLFERPILTTSQIQKEQEVSFGTAQKYVEQLQDAGLLREITGQARNRVYQADQILQVLEESLDPAG